MSAAVPVTTITAIVCFPYHITIHIVLSHMIEFTVINIIRGFR